MSKKSRPHLEQVQQITRDNEHPTDLIRLKNRDILLTYGERNSPFGVEAILRHDGGTSWDEKTILAKDAAHRDCGYPVQYNMDDGKILTMCYQVDDAQSHSGERQAKMSIWSAPGK